MTKHIQRTRVNPSAIAALGKVATISKLILPLVSLIIAPCAQAADGALSPLVLKGRYVIAWSGIPLGRIILTANEDATNYSMVIDTKTKGIGALISDEKRVISVEGAKTAADVYIPSRYQSRPHRKGERNTITMTYDAAGNIATRENDNEDDPAWRPPVPREEANTARDPVTAAFILRRKLHASFADKITDISTRTYDGERLATMSLIPAGDDARVEVMGAYVKAINVVVKRAPINGYTPKEIKKYKKGDPEIRIYFSNDEAFIPLRATAKVPLGELSMTLEERD